MAKNMYTDALVPLAMTLALLPESSMHVSIGNHDSLCPKIALEADKIHQVGLNIEPWNLQKIHSGTYIRRLGYFCKK